MCAFNFWFDVFNKKEFHVTRGILCDLGSYVIRGVKLNVKRRQNDEKKNCFRKM